MENYKKYKIGKVTCRDFTDSSKVCAHAKAWQVFFSYLNKKGWDDTQPMPRSHSIDWFLELASEVITNV